jgi:hypothetical protein
VSGRTHGRSGWSALALWRFAVDAVTSFSTVPLRIWSYLGVLVSAFALSYGAFIVLHTLIFGKDVPGYPSLFAAITFFSGVQLISLGVLGEYLGRVFVEVKRRPLFIVAETEGFEPERPHRRRAGDEIMPEGERARLFSFRDGR